MRWALWLAVVAGLAGWADTLVLSDGTVLTGRVQGLTPTQLGFLTAEGLRWVALEDVQRLALDLGEDPRPRVDRRAWSRALGRAQRELWTCQYFREGLVLAGLLFLGAGQWLVSLGHGSFGGLLTALGALGLLYGLGSARPDCSLPAARLRTLLYLGLEHGWLF
ncbi:MAG: hypothetical protein NZ924_05455 [Candidatus Bipolaricaulota bacterium]|nr:hypothetical protein [Candidatus Bipolaricaulota bacterium]MDW8152335.1 hypothetical protein [Candidatus Bipolaricaulota bacterium]